MPIEGGDILASGSGPWNNLVLATMIRFLEAEQYAAWCLGETELAYLDSLCRTKVPLACWNLSDRYRRDRIHRYVDVRGVLITSLVDPLLTNESVLDDWEPSFRALESFMRGRKQCGIVFLHASNKERVRSLGRLSQSDTPLFVVDTHHGHRTLLGTARCGESVVIRTELDGRQLATLRVVRASDSVLNLKMSRGAAIDHLPRPGVALFETSVVKAGSGQSQAARQLLTEYVNALSTNVEKETSIYSGFVGSEKCADCHRARSQRFHSTAHAKAMQSLRAVGRATRADCYACHVTGDISRTKKDALPAPAPSHLENVQCEICHGPGAAHAQSANAHPMVLPTKATCVRCHVAEFDPLFDFDRALRHASCQPR